jgi:hypothetical protein
MSKGGEKCFAADNGNLASPYHSKHFAFQQVPSRERFKQLKIRPMIHRRIFFVSTSIDFFSNFSP